MLQTVLEQQATTYEKVLKSYLALHNLPVGELDHVAIKLADTRAYEHCLHDIRPLCRTLTVTPMNNRHIATAQLIEPLSLGSLGQTVWLEIMEPRPEKVGHDYVGLEHCELFVPDLAAVESELQAKKIPYESYSNPYHNALVIKLNPSGQEVKFTNNRLGSIVKAQLAQGEISKVLK